MRRKHEGTRYRMEKLQETRRMEYVDDFSLCSASNHFSVVNGGKRKKKNEERGGRENITCAQKRIIGEIQIHVIDSYIESFKPCAFSRIERRGDAISRSEIRPHGRVYQSGLSDRRELFESALSIDR